MRPFCHLLLHAVRRDSPPHEINGRPIAQLLVEWRSKQNLTQETESDSSYWSYQYDSLGQVISGKKYWSDGTPVAGQQFEYNFDDIGNRKTTAAGGDQFGASLRYAYYGPNPLNQYTNITVPAAVDVLGSATNTATVRSYRASLEVFLARRISFKTTPICAMCRTSWGTARWPPRNAICAERSRT